MYKDYLGNNIPTGIEVYKLDNDYFTDDQMIDYFNWCITARKNEYEFLDKDTNVTAEQALGTLLGEYELYDGVQDFMFEAMDMERVDNG